MPTALAKQDEPKYPASRDPKVQALQKWIEGPMFQRQLARAMRSTVPPDTIARMAITVAQKTPKLLDCSPQSFAGALIECCQMGLEPDSALGQAYLVPYGQVCTLIPGYRGLIQLAYRSGKVASFEANAAYARDDFDVQLGDESKITHRPCRTADRGELIAAYAVVTIIGGTKVKKVLWRHEIDAVRERSMASKSGKSPWHTDFEAMAIKTAVKRICKMIPTSPDLQHAVSLDDQADANIGQSFIDLEPIEPEDAGASRTESLGKRLAKPKADHKPKPAPKKEEPSPDVKIAGLRAKIKDAHLKMAPEDAVAFRRNVNIEKISDVDQMELADLESVVEALG